jgi:hypothetical protein
MQHIEMHGWTSVEAAHQMGISVHNLHCWAMGRRSPSRPNVLKIEALIGRAVTEAPQQITLDAYLKRCETLYRAMAHIEQSGITAGQFSSSVGITVGTARALLRRLDTPHAEAILGKMAAFLDKSETSGSI